MKISEGCALLEKKTVKREKNDKRNASHITTYIIIGYILIYSIAAFALYKIIISSGKTLVQQYDAYDQYYPFLLLLRKYYRSFLHGIRLGKIEIPMFDFSLGYGFDPIKYLSYYGLGDFLNFPVAFVPQSMVLGYFEFLFFLRPFLAGLSFILLCFHFNKKNWMSLCSAFIYLCGGSSLFIGYTHPFFINQLIYLPLLVIGIDKIIDQKRSLILTISVFLCACTGFYFLYVVSIFAVIFAIIHVFFHYSNQENAYRKIIFVTIRAIIAYIIGVMMAMIIFLPCVLGFLESGRSASANTPVMK